MSSLVRPAHLRPTESSVPAVAAFVVGLLVHGAYEVVAVRAGPVPIVVTAPVVATLAYLRFAPASRLRIAALLGWGAVASVAGVVGVYLLTANYYLPRALTPVEAAVYDLGMFLWFVAAATGAYALAARRPGRPAAAAVVAVPAVQAAFHVLVVVAVAGGAIR